MSGEEAMQVAPVRERGLKYDVYSLNKYQELSLP